MFKVLLVCVLVVGVVVPAIAIQPRPAAIVEETITPDCITVKTSSSYENDVGPIPAIELKNDCASDITITDIQGDAGKVAFVLIEHSKSYEDHEFVAFAGSDAACERATKEIEIRFQKALVEDSAARVENEWRRSLPPIKRIPLHCKKMTLPANVSFILGLHYGTNYKILGYTEKSLALPTKLNINVLGKMINPTDTKSSDAIKLAESGDNQTRYNLALGYIWEKRDYDIALRWLVAAANDGHYPAQRQLISCYSNGKCGQPINLEESYFWASIAGYNTGFFDAENKVRLEKELTSAQITAVKNRVDAWQKNHPTKK